MASIHENSSSDGDCDSMPIAATASLSIGHDNAADARICSNPPAERRSDLALWDQNVSPASGPPRYPAPCCSDPGNLAVDHRIHRPYSQSLAKLLSTSQLPVNSLEPVPHAFQLALANRFPASQFDAGGDLDPEEMTPIFIHDVLMLPGSLANLIGKPHVKDVLDKITPARSHGARLYLQAETTQPILRPPTSLRTGSMAYCSLVQAGAPGNDSIATTAPTQVMYEVVVTLPPSEPNGHVERRLEQRTTIAEVYVWSDEAARVRPNPVNAASWTLQDFLGGKYNDIAVFQDGVLPGWHFNGMREGGGYEVMEATTETSKRAEVEMGSDVGEERREGAVDVARMGWFVW